MPLSWLRIISSLRARWATWPRRWRLSASLSALVLAVTILASALLPEIGVRWGVFETMRRLGMTEISITGTEVELFNGRLVIHRLFARPKIGQALGLDQLDFAFRWLPLFRREVSVPNLDLSGLSIDIRRDGNRLIVNGAAIDLTPGAGEQSLWSFDIDSARLTASRIDLAQGNFHLGIDVELLEVRTLKTADPATPTQFRFKGRIDGSPVELSGTALLFAATPSIDLSFSAERLDLAVLAPLLAPSGIDNLNGKLTAALTLSGSLAPQAPQVKTEGKLVLAEPQLSLNGAQLNAGEIAWNGRLNLSQRGEAAGQLTINGLKAEKDGMQMETDGLTLGAENLTWDIAASPGAIVRFTGKLENGGTRIRAPSWHYRHERVQTAGSIEFDRQANGDAQISAILGVEAKAMRAYDPVTGNELLHAQKLEAKSVRLERHRMAADGAMQAEALSLDGLTFRLIRARPANSEKAEAKAEAPKEAGKPSSPSARLALGKFAIGGASRLEFVDNTPSQPVEMVFDKVSLSISNLDSAQPGRESPFDIAARAGGATMTVKGTAKPFASGMSAKFSSQVKAFELPPLSPYTADALGVELQTGHFDGELAFALEAGSLNGKMDLALSNLFAAQPDPNAPIAKQTGMPVSLVLDLLRDGEDRIRLSIPVGGNLSDPQFDLSDAISQAIGGALRSTALTTLKVVFPVLVLIDGLTDQSAPALAPITFHAGADGIDEQGRSRLDTIGELMKSRPGIKLSLCPVAVTGTDWAVLLEQRKKEELGLLYRMQKMVNLEAKPQTTPPDMAALSALAERRAETVKSILAGKAGIDPGRLFSCRPQINNDPLAVPRVDLTL